MKNTLLGISYIVAALSIASCRTGSLTSTYCVQPARSPRPASSTSQQPASLAVFAVRTKASPSGRCYPVVPVDNENKDSHGLDLDSLLAEEPNPTVSFYAYTYPDSSINAIHDGTVTEVVYRKPTWAAKMQVNLRIEKEDRNEFTEYFALKSTTVKAGDRVACGDHIGTAGVLFSENIKDQTTAVVRIERTRN